MIELLRRHELREEGMRAADRARYIPRMRAHVLLAPLLASLILLQLGQAAEAVLIAGPDGSINTTPPSPDPGFGNVGSRQGLTGVYVRNGWVLTASHVGIGPIDLDGTTYDPVPGSDIRFSNTGGGLADLIAFKLKLRPALPDLTLVTAPLSVNDTLIMVGRGNSRGAATSWSGLDGWFEAEPNVIRWGTNRISEINRFELNTRAFATVFTDLNGPQRNDPEAQVVNGDSGGAAFYYNGAAPELAGILYARSTFEGQPLNTAIFGNASLIVDLDYYHPQIIAVIDVPDCDDGLDEDGDGFIDFPADPGCDDALDDDEQNNLLICDNGFDDDMDGLTDFPEDDGCDDSLDASEVPEPALPGAIMAGLGLLGAGFRRAPDPRLRPQSQSRHRRLRRLPLRRRLRISKSPQR